MNLFRKANAKQNLDPTASDLVHFGPVPLHESELSSHCLLCGATGSGKTTLLRLLLQCIIPTILPGSDRRALITNPKGDMLPILLGMALHAAIKTLDPFDIRGVAWAIARDAREVRVAVEITYTLFHNEPGQHPFFAKATRHIAFCVIISFNLSGLDWTLADLLRVLRSVDYIRAVLKKHAYTAPVYELYFSDPKLAASVIASIATRLLPYDPIAAAWEHAPESVSLQEWAESEYVLVLPHSEICRSAVDNINRCLVKRATDVILGQSESFTRRSVLIFDELSDSGELGSIVPFAKKSRSKGGVLIISFQGVPALRHRDSFGPEQADELLGQIGNHFIGRLECHATAEWASKLIGDQEVEGVSQTTTFGADAKAPSETRQFQMRRAVLPSEFMSIEPCGIDTGLSGFYVIRSAGTFFHKLDAEDVFSNRLLPLSDDPACEPRSPDAQYLRMWTAEEARRFGAVNHALENAARSEHELSLDDLNDLFK